MNNRELGRSMIEMIGVLAVIGVLSVTGLSLYGTAMGKLHANDLLDEVQKRVALIGGQQRNVYTRGMFDSDGPASGSGVTAYGYGVEDSSDLVLNCDAGDPQCQTDVQTEDNCRVIEIDVGEVNGGNALTPAVCQQLRAKMVSCNCNNPQCVSKRGDLFGIDGCFNADGTIQEQISDTVTLQIRI